MSPDPAPVTPQGRAGLSTGGKLFLGCLGLVVIGGLLAVLTLGAGALFVGKAAREVVSEVRGEGASGDLLRELETRHAFTPPPDGVVGDAHARRMAEAVEEVWTRLEPLRAEMDAATRSAGEPTSLRDAVGGLQTGIRGLEGMRQALADGLAEAEVSLQEFLWTSGRLIGAYRSLDMPQAPEGMPEANREMARRHRMLIASLAGGGDDRADRSGVLAVAMGAGGIFALEELWTP
jgi:hypothetical protein